MALLFNIFMRQALTHSFRVLHKNMNYTVPLKILNQNMGNSCEFVCFRLVSPLLSISGREEVKH